MKLSEEQIKILDSDEDIKIHAVAGSGKTTTLIHYAESRKAGSRILYLAFNRKVKEEAQGKFDQKHVYVKVETAHSLAFQNVVIGSGLKIKQGDYKLAEIVEILNLQRKYNQLLAFKVAAHIIRFVQFFCNSSASKVEELNYLQIISDSETRKFVQRYYQEITRYTRIFLAYMNNGQIDVIHDFYLKKYQLSGPKLNYDYILFDEGQDASPAMLDVFLRQRAKKVIVGDTHQQIYSWRYAVNSLDKVNFKEYELHTSFRFNSVIANLANRVLLSKRELSDNKIVQVQGDGGRKKVKSKAVIARTNLGLLVEAINLVSDQPSIKKIYFEGNLNAYLFTDNGTSLYDVLYLTKGKIHKIRDPLTKSFESTDALQDYIEATEDLQLKMMLDIVNRYGDDIHEHLANLKDKNLPKADKEDAEYIFSTVHKCKGLEFDLVRLAQDFTTEEQIKKQLSRKDLSRKEYELLNEEINLLYVAITRTTNKIELAKKYLPDGESLASQVRVLQNEAIKKQEIKELSLPSFNASKSEKRLKSYPKPLADKTAIDQYQLKKLFRSGMPIPKIARFFGVSNSEVYRQIKALKLDEY